MHQLPKSWQEESEPSGASRAAEREVVMTSVTRLSSFWVMEYAIVEKGYEAEIINCHAWRQARERIVSLPGAAADAYKCSRDSRSSFERPDESGPCGGR